MYNSNGSQWWANGEPMVSQIPFTNTQAECTMCVMNNTATMVTQWL